MSLKYTATCDVCGVERKEANHWFLVMGIAAAGRKFENPLLRAVVIQEWQIESAQSTDACHACGFPHACLLAERIFAKSRLDAGALADGHTGVQP